MSVTCVPESGPLVRLGIRVGGIDRCSDTASESTGRPQGKDAASACVLGPQVPCLDHWLSGLECHCLVPRSYSHTPVVSPCAVVHCRTRTGSRAAQVLRDSIRVGCRRCSHLWWAGRRAGDEHGRQLELVEPQMVPHGVYDEELVHPDGTGGTAETIAICALRRNCEALVVLSCSARITTRRTTPATWRRWRPETAASYGRPRCPSRPVRATPRDCLPPAAYRWP